VRRWIPISISLALALSGCRGPATGTAHGGGDGPLHRELVLAVAQRIDERAIVAPDRARFVLETVWRYQRAFAPRLELSGAPLRVVATCGAESRSTPPGYETPEGFTASALTLAPALAACLDPNRLGRLADFEQAFLDSALRTLGFRSQWLPAGGDEASPASAEPAETFGSRLIGSIGYVRIPRLAGGTRDALVERLPALRKAGARAIVLDLRGNTGGHVGETIGVVDAFVAKGTDTVTQLGREHGMRYSASEDGPGATLPIALLVDRETGSGAEVVALSLRLSRGAPIFGERTAGMPMIDSYFPVGKTGAGFRITTGMLAAPGPTRVPDGGLEPSFPVDPAGALDAAIAHLSGTPTATP
jgi:hypothetical protein